jgi:hypothetical protein
VGVVPVTETAARQSTNQQLAGRNHMCRHHDLQPATEQLLSISNEVNRNQPVDCKEYYTEWECDETMTVTGVRVL